MNLEAALTAAVVVAVIFLVAYGLLMIHIHGYHLGRLSYFQALTWQHPTDPSKPEKPKEEKKPVVEGPPVYSPVETYPEPNGPMDPVAPYAETPLGPPVS